MTAIRRTLCLERKRERERERENKQFNWERPLHLAGLSGIDVFVYSTGDGFCSASHNNLLHASEMEQCSSMYIFILM